MTVDSAGVATPDSGPAPATKSHRWHVLAACCLLGLSTAAVPAVWALLPAATPEVFGVSALRIQLETQMGVLVFVAFMLGGGTLGDLLGRRRLLLVAAAGLVVASLVSALAPGDAIFLIGRLGLALCGGIIVSLAIAVLRVTFEPRDMPKALGVYFGLLGLAQIGIPSVLPIVTQNLSWRLTFVLAMALGTIGAWCTWKYIPESRAQGGTRRHEAIGLAAWSVILLALLFALSSATNGPYAGTYLLTALVVAMIGLGVLIWLGVYTHGVALGRGLPYKRALSLALVAGVLVNLAFAGTTVQLVNFFLTIQRDRLIIMALKLGPLGIGALAGGLLAARLAGKWPIQRIVTAALVLMGLAIAALGLLLTPRVAYVWLIAPILFMALGFSVVNTYVADIILGLVPRDLAGSAGGISEAVGRIGGTLGPLWTSTLLVYFGGDLYRQRLLAAGLSGEQIKAALAKVNGVLQTIQPGASVPDLTTQLRQLVVGYAQAYAQGLGYVLLCVAALCLLNAAAVWVGMPRQQQRADSMAGSDSGTNSPQVQGSEESPEAAAL